MGIVNAAFVGMFNAGQQPRRSRGGWSRGWHSPADRLAGGGGGDLSGLGFGFGEGDSKPFGFGFGDPVEGVKGLLLGGRGVVFGAADGPVFRLWSGRTVLVGRCLIFDAVCGGQCPRV